MKISNNFSLNFKSNDMNKTETSLNKGSSEQREDFLIPSSENMRAYTITNIGKGIENAILKPDYDGYQIIYNIKPLSLNSQKAKVIYTIGKEKKQREAFSTAKNKKNGVLKVEIPVLNRETNTIIEKLKINSVEYFDDFNKETAKETPKNLVINPNAILKIKEDRYSDINGVTQKIEMDSISEGTSIGKLVEKEYEDMIRYKGTEPIIAILSKADMDELLLELMEGTFSLPMNVKGIIASPEYYEQGGMLTDCLGHAVARLRGRKTFALVDNKTLDNIKTSFLNNKETPYIKLELGMSKIKVSGLKELPEPDKSEVKLPVNSLVNKLLTPEDEDFTQEAVGLKAYNLGRLKRLQNEGNFKVPSFFVVPAGVWNYTKKSPENMDVYGDDNDSKPAQMGSYHFYTQKADAAENPSTELAGIRRMITEDLIIPKDIRTQIKEKAIKTFDINKMINDEGCLIARSSFNGEDSDTIATQGLYDSFPGIRTSEQLYKGIREVWASKWSDLAYTSRRDHNIPHSSVQPNVIVQQVVPVDYTFTIYTADPRGNDKNKIICQLSQGVYSCFPNSPYIFEYDKTTGEINRTALATKKRTKPIDKVIMDDFINANYEMADYSKDPLNMSKKKYAPIMKKVFEVAKFIEKNFGNKPQDIEGGIIFKPNPETGELEPEIHIWQTRDVHLIKR